MTPRHYRLLSALNRGYRRIKRSGTARSCVLCYHSVHPTLRFRSCTPELFRAHLEWLGAHCRPVPLEELASRAGDPAPAGKPLVAITFDDGYQDNYKYALPALLDYGVPATFFVTAGFLDRDPEVLDQFQRLRRLPAGEIEPMTWDQARELLHSGMAVEAHTYSHPNLYYSDASKLEFEIGWTRDFLEDRLGHPVSGFAYPFGRPHCHFDSRVTDAVRSAGYRYAVSISYRGIPRGASIWQIPRFSVKRDPVQLLAEKIAGALDPIGIYHEWCPRWVGRIRNPRGYRADSYGRTYSGLARPE